MRLLLLLVLLVLTPGLIFPGLIFAADEDFTKGMKYYHQGSYAKAVKHLDAYLENNPDPYAYYVKGYALYKMRRYREAVADFKDAYMVGPEFKLKRSKETLKDKEASPKEALKDKDKDKKTSPKETSTETP
jgi:tetratricopeptide (TPR) repeat protein